MYKSWQTEWYPYGEYMGIYMEIPGNMNMMENLRIKLLIHEAHLYHVYDRNVLD